VSHVSTRVRMTPCARVEWPKIAQNVVWHSISTIWTRCLQMSVLVYKADNVRLLPRLRICLVVQFYFNCQLHYPSSLISGTVLRGWYTVLFCDDQRNIPLKTVCFCRFHSVYHYYIMYFYNPVVIVRTRYCTYLLDFICLCVWLS
jgi:hypothetical protein